MLTLASTQAHAYYYGEDDANVPLQGLKYRWSLGFDVAHQTMKAINDFSALTYNNRQGMDLNVAYRTRGPLGFEFGFYWTNDKAKNINTVPGTQLLGATSQTTATYQYKLRVENTYLDAYWHYKIKRRYELKLGLGVGFERQNFAFYNSAGVTDPVQQALYVLEPDTTMTARFNVGLQTMLTNRIGGRILFSYETTSSIKVTNFQAGVDPHMFGNSYTVFLGFFYTITGYFRDSEYVTG